MKVKDISKVLHGKHTSALLTPLAVDAPDRFCFSIISTKLHRSIDLEASEETTAAEFARAVDHIMEQAKAARARWSLPAPPYQMPVTQASLSRALNASLIQYNSKTLVKPRVRRSKSRKLSGKKAAGESRPVKPSSSSSSSSSSQFRKPKVGSKRKTKCSPVLGASQSRVGVVLADCPTD
jgi:hypothetical protein